MSKTKKSKLLATMLCATVVAGLYAGPVMADNKITNGTSNITVEDNGGITINVLNQHVGDYSIKNNHALFNFYGTISAGSLTGDELVVEGNSGSFKVKDIPNDNGGSTMVYTSAKNGTNTMWLDTATGNLSTIGTISVGGELGGLAKTIIDGTTGDISVGVNGDGTQKIHLNATTGSITATDYNGVTLATNGTKVLVGGIDVKAMNDNVAGIVRTGDAINGYTTKVEGVDFIQQNDGTTDITTNGTVGAQDGQFDKSLQIGTADGSKVVIKDGAITASSLSLEGIDGANKDVAAAINELKTTVGAMDSAGLPEKVGGIKRTNDFGLNTTTIEGVVSVSEAKNGTPGKFSILNYELDGFGEEVFSVNDRGYIDAKAVNPAGDTKSTFKLNDEEATLLYGENGIKANAAGTTISGAGNDLKLDANGATFTNANGTTVINGNTLTTGNVVAGTANIADGTLTVESGSVNVQGSVNVGTGTFVVKDGVVSALNGAVEMGNGSAGAYVKVGNDISFQATTGNITANSFNNVTLEKQNGAAIINGVNINELQGTVDGMVDAGLPEKVGGIEREGNDTTGYTTTIEDSFKVHSTDGYDVGTIDVYGSIIQSNDADGGKGVLNGDTLTLTGTGYGNITTISGGNITTNTINGVNFSDWYNKVNDNLEELNDKTQNINSDATHGGNGETGTGGEVVDNGANTGFDGDVTVGGEINAGTGTIGNVEMDNNGITVGGGTTITNDTVDTTHVDAETGDFSDSVTVGTDGNKTTIDGGTITTGDTTINGDGMTVGSGVTEGADGILTGDKVTVGDGNVQVEWVDADGKKQNTSIQENYDRINALDDRVTSEVNRLDNRIDKVEDRVDKVGAMAAAIANLRTMGYDPAAPTEIAVGIGQYRSETGAALGLFHYPNRDFMLSLSVSTSGDEVMGGIGATWKFGRKTPEQMLAAEKEKAAKAKLAKAEAMKKAAAEAKVAAQQAKHAKMAAEKAAK